MGLDFNKSNGLVPVIIQNQLTMQVLMLGYMNQEAYHKTLLEKKVTFFSRSKNRLWTKGETSGNFLWVKDIFFDCDNDTLLILVNPKGAVCHTGSNACFNQQYSHYFLYELEEIITKKIEKDEDASYTNTLYKSGINKIAQKVGEEAIEVVIEAKDNNLTLFKNEAADLLYHFLILLKAKEVTLNDIEIELKKRLK